MAGPSPTRARRGDLQPALLEHAREPAHGHDHQLVVGHADLGAEPGAGEVGMLADAVGGDLQYAQRAGSGPDGGADHGVADLQRCRSRHEVRDGHAVDRHRHRDPLGAVRAEEREQRRGQLVGVDERRPERPGDLAEPPVGRGGVLHVLQLDPFVRHAALHEDLGQRPVGGGDHHVVAAVGRSAGEVDGVHLAAAEVELVDGDQQAQPARGWAHGRSPSTRTVAMCSVAGTISILSVSGSDGSREDRKKRMRGMATTAAPIASATR
jgi:hypothetical protein